MFELTRVEKQEILFDCLSIESHRVVSWRFTRHSRAGQRNYFSGFRLQQHFRVNRRQYRVCVRFLRSFVKISSVPHSNFGRHQVKSHQEKWPAQISRTRARSSVVSLSISETGQCWGKSEEKSSVWFTRERKKEEKENFSDKIELFFDSGEIA